jgi:hypothetical protein
MAKHQKIFRNFYFEFHLNFAMSHVRFMVSPELYGVQEALTFDIALI